MFARALRRVAVVALLVPSVVMVAALPAAAHVTVHPGVATAGTSDADLAFRVPNEMTDAHTVKVRLFLPTPTPLLGVSVAATPGWVFAVRTIALAHPVTTDDGPITSAVSQITWTGGAIPIGGYQDFDISVGRLPSRPGPLTFKVLQTYGNGKVVRWIETAAPGAVEPEHPAPVLRLTAPGSTQPMASAGDGGDRSLAIAALVVAVVALWVSIARRRRHYRHHQGP